MEFENPKLFVGGISEETDEAKLTEYFSQFGEVKHVFVHSDKRIGFVTYSDPSMARDALQHEHIIFDRTVDVKPAKPRTHKVFVGGLPLDITQETFKEYFERYGTIIDAVIIPDKESGRFRGFGFVTYDSEEAASNVLRHNFHQLNNKTVEVKRAQPKEKMRRSWDRPDSSPAAVEMNDFYNVNTQPQPVTNLPGGYAYDYSTGPNVYDYSTGSDPYQYSTGYYAYDYSTGSYAYKYNTGYYAYDYSTGSYVWVPVTDGSAPLHGSFDQVYYHANSNPWQRPIY